MKDLGRDPYGLYLPEGSRPPGRGRQSPYLIGVLTRETSRVVICKEQPIAAEAAPV